MEMTRRGFLGSILAAAVAPAIVRADSLMRIVPMETLIIPSAASFAGAIRELRQFDVIRDEFISRWDIAGYVGGELQQFHVSLSQEESIPTLVSDRESPVVIQARRKGEYQIEKDREIALAVLRVKVRDTGMLVVSNVLKLPEGMHSARFLG